jgi:retron-type reverse transcriptase
VLALHHELRSGVYEPAPYSQHVVHDPKTRLISAPAVRDRVLHQAVIAELAPFFERSYIHDSYACLPGLGPQRAVLRYPAWTRRYRWRLALDIRRYFPSVDHAILLGLLARPLRDRDTLALLRRLVESGAAVYHTELARQILALDRDPLPPGTGLPIGSSVSQWAANLYLDGLDHFVKRVLRVRAYLRYMDDAVLFADDRTQLLDACAAISAWLGAERRLVLNPGSGHVVPAAQPSTWLGYRVSRAGLSPGHKVRRRLRENVRAAAERSQESMYQSLVSYRSLVSFG